MTRSPAPRAVHHFTCNRCGRGICAYGIVTECFSCIDKAVTVFQLGPVEGEASGC